MYFGNFLQDPRTLYVQGCPIFLVQLVHIRYDSGWDILYMHLNTSIQFTSNYIYYCHAGIKYLNDYSNKQKSSLLGSAFFLAKIHNVCNILQQTGDLKPKRAVKPVLDVGKSLKSDDLQKWKQGGISYVYIYVLIVQQMYWSDAKREVICNIQSLNQHRQ